MTLARFWQGVTTFWDWVDDRQIDQHALALVVIWMTWQLMVWSMGFMDRAMGAHDAATFAAAAANVAAVWVPWSPVFALVINWWFQQQKQKQS